jgi:hypothetical protein
VGRKIFHGFLGVFFFGLWLAAGLFGVYKLATELPQALASDAWPSLEGRIVEARYRHRTRESRSRFSILYAYRVDAQDYDGREIRFMGSVFGDNARTKAARYRAGEPVRVYYDPKRAEHSILETGVHWPGFAGVTIFTFVAVSFGLLGFRGMFFKGGK